MGPCHLRFRDERCSAALPDRASFWDRRAPGPTNVRSVSSPRISFAATFGISARLPDAIAIALVLGLAASAAGTKAAEDPRDLWSDTWAATDTLGRTLPGSAEVGLPRTGRFVGIFYFLWLGQSGDLGPFDISRILAQDPSALTNPASPLWGPMLSPHHWGESIFGYYVSEDESVLRKHAQMLANAGVDAVFFDVTNQLHLSSQLESPLPRIRPREARGEPGTSDRLPLPVRRPAQGGPRALGRPLQPTP